MSIHYVSGDGAPDGVTVGDSIVAASRGKAAWCAKLGAKHPKYGRVRNFIIPDQERSGMSKQIVKYSFEIKEPGEYEMAGDEFGEYRYTFRVR